MSIAKFTSIRTVSKFTALTTVQESSGCNMAETYESLLYWYQGEQSGFDANKTQTPQKKTTCNTSQLSKSIRSKESKGSNLRYLDSGRMSRHHGGHHNERLVRRTHSVCVALVPGWESLKIHWLNYHHCHCPHWLMPILVGNPCKSPLSNTPTWIWICTDFFPTHPVVS